MRSEARSEASLAGPEANIRPDTLAFDRLIAALSARFIALPPEAIDAHIEGTLGSVAELLGCDRASVAQPAPEEGVLRLTHHWRRDGIAPLPEVSDRDLPWLAERMARGQNLVIASRSELPPEAVAERQFVERHGQRSFAIFPLTVGGGQVGLFACATVRQERSWPTEIVERLQLVGEIIASALGRKQADMALRAALAENERLRRQLEAENVYLRQEIKEAHDFGEIVGKSAPLRAALHQVDQVAGTDAPVLLLGETGTGKELFARAIHARSQRSQHPLITVNCAALPATLIESELFGHEKGAFTGASQARPGRFELADRGTLFLDEIGDLDPALQAKLLRVLQDGETQRLGSARPRTVDVRVIAATNRHLPLAMREGRFRADLYYRLSVFPIVLPPLRERREDVPLLVWYFIQSRQHSVGRKIEQVPRAVMNALAAYDWPGNVRELQNVIERAMILSRGPVLHADRAFLVVPGGEEPRAEGGEALEEAERLHILRVLERCQWTVEGRGKAADRLGVKPSTLRNRMRRLGIRRPSGA